MLVVFPLDPGPLIELRPDNLGLQGPTIPAHLGHHLVVVLSAQHLREVLVRLPVQHEGVHGALDLSGGLGLGNLLKPRLPRPVDVRFDISHRDVGMVVRKLAEWVENPTCSLCRLYPFPFILRRRLPDPISLQMC